MTQRRHPVSPVRGRALAGADQTPVAGADHLHPIFGPKVQSVHQHLHGVADLARFANQPRRRRSESASPVRTRTAPPAGIVESEPARAWRLTVTVLPRGERAVPGVMMISVVPDDVLVLEPQSDV